MTPLDPVGLPLDPLGPCRPTPWPPGTLLAYIWTPWDPLDLPLDPLGPCRRTPWDPEGLSLTPWDPLDLPLDPLGLDRDEQQITNQCKKGSSNGKPSLVMGLNPNM